jgi:hypothetical protein
MHDSVFPKRSLLLVLLAMLSVAAVGCDSSGPEIEEAEEVSRGDIAPQKTADALTSIKSKLDGLRQDTTLGSERDLWGELQSAVQAIEKVDMVEDTRLPDDRLTATVVLKNGITMVLGNNRPDIDSTSLNRGSPSSRSIPNSRSSGGGSFVEGSDGRFAASTPNPAGNPSSAFPKSRKAVAIAHDGGSDQARQVRDQLAEAGYNTGGIGASLPEMRNEYKDLGVLYLDTHGGTYNTIRGEPGRVGSDTIRFALETSTRADLTPAWIKAYEAELLNGELVLSTWCVLGANCIEDVGRDSVSASGTDVKVAVTERFISKHWTFADGGMAFIHACRIGNDNYPGAQAIRESILQNAGARSLIATQGDTNAKILEKGIVSTFKMLLGTARKEFGRPWDLQSAKAALSEMGLLQYDWWSGELDYDPPADVSTPDYETTKLRFYGSKSVRLAPSTRRMEAIDDAARSAGTLRIKGSFPSSQGEVLLGSKELSIRSWSQDEIVAKVPFGGPASSGPVRVDADQGIRGNRVSLTKWTGSLSAVVEGNGNQVSRSTGEIIFRGDVHPTRASPTADPTLPKEVEAYVSPPSQASLQANGVGSDGNVKWLGDYNYSLATKSEVDLWYGGGPFQPQSQPQAQPQPRAQAESTDPDFGVPPKMFGGKVLLKPRGGTGEMCLRLSKQVSVEDANDGQDLGSLPFPVPVILAAQRQSVDLTKGQPTLGCFQLSFRDVPSDPTVAGREVSYSGPSSSSEYVSVEVEWSGLQAKGQPLPRSEGWSQPD